MGWVCTVCGRDDTSYSLGDKAEGRRQVADGTMNLTSILK
jgi:hypothetical protein